MATKKKASLGGRLSTKIARAFVHSKFLASHGGLFGNSFVSAPSRFKAPRLYCHECFSLDGLPVEKLSRLVGTPSEKVILDFHGGGYQLPLSDVYRRAAVRFSRISGGATVFNIDYRLAPEFTFPAPLEDAMKVWDYLLSEGYKPENIIITGDSAGGNLALAHTLTLRDSGRELPRALVLMSPWADLAGKGKSYRERVYMDPLFGLNKGDDYDAKEAELNGSVSKPYAGDTPLDTPLLSPAYADYAGFPPMLLQIGECEMLYSDSETIYNNAISHGVDATFTEYPGVFHVFQMMAVGREKRAAWEEVGRFLRKHFEA